MRATSGSVLLSGISFLVVRFSTTSQASPRNRCSAHVKFLRFVSSMSKRAFKPQETTENDEKGMSSVLADKPQVLREDDIADGPWLGLL